MNNQSKEILTNLLIFLGTCVFMALIFEFGIRFYSSQKRLYSVEMNKYAQRLQMPDPSGQTTHTHRPNASAKLMGTEIALNSLGQRGKEIGPKSKEAKRILALGSSITMGWGVSQEEVFTSVLERKLNEAKPLGAQTSFEVVNAGIGNYNTVYQYHRLLSQYDPVRPDMIVLHYFIDDAKPDPQPTKSGALIKRSYLLSFLYEKLGGLRFKSGQKGTLVDYYRELYDDNGPYWKNAKDAVSKMKEKAQSDNVPFLVMIVPDFHNLAADSPYKDFYSKIEKTFKDMGITTLNAFEPFQKKYGSDASELWIQPDDPHPNAKGHELMADLLYQYLTAKKNWEMKRT